MLDTLLKRVRTAARSIVSSFRDYPRLVSCSDAFSLDQIQLYVGKVEDDTHTIRGGISFQMPRQGWPINRAIVLHSSKATEFVVFLQCLEAERLPCSITFPRHDSDLRWEVVKVKRNWHGGGGLVGFLHGNWLADHSNPARVIITKDSAAKLRRCIAQRYSATSD